MKMTRGTNLRSLIRWKDWSFDKVLSLFFVAFYVALVDGLFYPFYLVQFAVLLVFAILSAAYGFLTNDLGDREIDRRQGKFNAFHHLDPTFAPPLLVGLLLAAALVGFPFWQAPGFLLLWGLWVVIATAYSLPPVRLKERGLWGVIAPAVAQSVLPPLLFFAAFDHLMAWDTVLLVAYFGMKGVSIALGQQKQDLGGDLRTETTTFAVQVGQEQIARIYTAALLVEQVLLAAVLILTLFQIPPLGWDGVIGRIPPTAPLLLGYVVLVLLAVRQVRTEGRVTDPYFDSDKDVFNLLYAIFPCGLVPFYMALLMSLHYLANLFILFLLILWAGPSPRKVLWPLRAILGSLSRPKIQTSEVSAGCFYKLEGTVRHDLCPLNGASADLRGFTAAKTGSTESGSQQETARTGIGHGTEDDPL
jgi:4-hydroxybenzoate polyprenyltransferase